MIIFLFLLFPSFFDLSVDHFLGCIFIFLAQFHYVSATDSAARNGLDGISSNKHADD